MSRPERPDAPPPAPRDARLFGLVGALGALALLAGTALLVAGGPILEHGVLPLVARVATDDGVVDDDAVPMLRAVLGLLTAAGLLGGAAMFLYGRLGRVVPARLVAPDEAPPVARAGPTGAGELLVVALAACALVALCAPHLDRGLSYDEAFTAMHFVETPSVWDSVGKAIVFNNHVAYSLLARGAVALGGSSETALRLPALLLGVGALLASWRFARAAWGLAVGLLSCALLAVAPMAVEWSSSARGYTGLLLCAVLASLLYRRLVNAPTRRDAVAWVAVCALGAWFHLYMGLVVAVQVAHLLLVSWRVAQGRARLDPRAFLVLWRALPPLAALVLLLHAPLLPRLVLAAATRPPGPFRADFPLRVLAELSGMLGGLPHQGRPWHGDSGWLLAAVAALALAGVVRMARRCHRQTAYLVLLVALPVLVTWLAAPYDLYPRFLVFALPFHVIAVAHGVLAARDAARRLLGDTAALSIAAALTAAVALAWAGAARRDVPEEGIRAAARAMTADAGDGVLLCAIGGGAELFRYYVREPVLVPETIDAFLAAAAGAREVRCAHRPTPWEPRHHALVADWLAERYEAERFGNVTLTRFEP